MDFAQTRGVINWFLIFAVCGTSLGYTYPQKGYTYPQKRYTYPQKAYHSSYRLDQYRPTAYKYRTIYIPPYATKCKAKACEYGEKCNPYTGNCENTKSRCEYRVCENQCHYGRHYNADGCMTCECAPHPCTHLTCPACQYCDPHDAVCVKRPCVDKPCDHKCEYGYELDDCGCATCKCKRDPCHHIKCEYGQYCDSHTATCEKHVCPLAICEHECLHGYELNEYGCNTCKCKPNLCDHIICGACQYCNPISAKCVNHECDYTTAGCDHKCDYGYEPDRCGCDTCRCKPDPCLYVTCDPGHYCDKLTAHCEIHVCAYVKCETPCVFGSIPDDHACATCHCRPDPCINVPCPGDQYCNTETGVCSGDTHECQYIECEYSCDKFGHVFDKHGCQTCQCKPDPCRNVQCKHGSFCNADIGKCVFPPSQKDHNGDGYGDQAKNHHAKQENHAEIHGKDHAQQHAEHTVPQADGHSGSQTEHHKDHKYQESITV